jgi:hypothetical protein
MKTKFFFPLLTLGLAVILSTGCQKAPQAELDQANAAVAAANAAEVNRYLLADYQAIQDSLNLALAGIEENNAKSAFSRKYDEPKRLLIVVTEMSNQAVANVQSKKEELKAQNEVLLGEVNAMVEANKALIVKAPKGKEGKAALELIQQDLSAIEASVASATEQMASGDILAANDKLTVAKAKAEAINAELTAAIDKAKGVKK